MSVLFIQNKKAMVQKITEILKHNLLTKLFHTYKKLSTEQNTFFQKKKSNKSFVEKYVHNNQMTILEEFKYYHCSHNTIS
jgi:hypothetical protein